MNDSQLFENIEKLIGYIFINKSLLKEALTHSSYSHENNLSYNYERLEFLGDAVLQLIVSEYLLLYGNDFTEGDMSIIRSHIVNEKFLSKQAKRLCIDKNSFVGKGVTKISNQVNDSILADMYESILGAIYLDSNYENAKIITLNLLSDAIDEASKNRIFFEAKGEVQQYTQKKYGTLPVYSIIKEEGPDHNKTYTVKLEIDDNLSFIGKASTKKKAEKEAAISALKYINNYNE